ncbi:hypothetical protein ABZ942_13200 [Nocardia sp. NPDC046473]|uniref:hypothetical protein n=1 Tax=Nocardia sp. NPDC046473 TaxID=3155733 RepID=UPI0033E8433A
MPAKGVGSVAAEGPKKRWSPFRWVAALVVIGLYLAAVTRLAVSKDWNDLTATHLLGLTGVVVGLLVLLSLVLEPVSVAGPRKRWTTRRTVVALVVAAVIVAGLTTSIIRTGAAFGDPMGQLFLQTAALGAMLFLIVDKPARDRP